ncbi:hypothetical protein [Ferruginibacter sp. SUN106]|uniref:hypothetical protein n=1 Tax=Ferruginibacter sp. SUN106 TaxID=2978348 RepID=UPI003D35DDCE
MVKLQQVKVLAAFNLHNKDVLLQSAPNAFGINAANAAQQEFNSSYKKIMTTLPRQD